jgi:hypothetical protein
MKRRSDEVREAGEDNYGVCVYFSTMNYDFSRAVVNAAIEDQIDFESLCGAPRGMRSVFLVFIHTEEDKAKLMAICKDHGVEIEI